MSPKGLIHAAQDPYKFSTYRVDIKREIKDWVNMDANEQFKQIMKIDILPIKTAKFISHIINWKP